MAARPRTPLGARAPFDQRIARVLVRSLARTTISPNQITTATLGLALLAAALFATGETPAIDWAAGVFVLARFLDHFDGELARLTDRTSRFGYYFDYASGGIGYAAIFAGIGVGLARGPLGGWALALGAVGTLAALVSMVLNLRLDRAGVAAGRETVGYPAAGGFELEDGIYLIAPATWIGWLDAFFVACGVGAAVYCLWTAGRVLRPRAAHIKPRRRR